MRQLDLASITGWQADRRRAVALLEQQLPHARRDGDFPWMGAIVAAIGDLMDGLRSAAEFEIADSVRMEFVHHAWPRRVAA